MEKPGKIIDTEETIDTGEDGKDAVPTLNPGSDKIIDTGEDANLRLHPGKAIIDNYRHCKEHQKEQSEDGEAWKDYRQ